MKLAAIALVPLLAGCTAVFPLVGAGVASIHNLDDASPPPPTACLTCKPVTSPEHWNVGHVALAAAALGLLVDLAIVSQVRWGH
jgi:hypothetical protein